MCGVAIFFLFTSGPNFSLISTYVHILLADLKLIQVVNVNYMRGHYRVLSIQVFIQVII